MDPHHVRGDEEGQARYDRLNEPAPPRCVPALSSVDRIERVSDAVAKRIDAVRARIPEWRLIAVLAESDGQ